MQTDGATDPAFRADVVVRVPRAAVIDRVQVLEGTLAINGFSGTLTADVRRGPIDGTDVSGTLRLETGIGSIALTDARLVAERTAAAARVQRRRAADAGRAARPTRASWRWR